LSLDLGSELAWRGSNPGGRAQAALLAQAVKGAYIEPMSFTVHAIDHVQVTCPPSKQAACIAFYRDVLTLPEIEKPDDLKARGGAWFQVGALQLHLGVDPEQETPKSKRHVCFLVDDLKAAEAALRDAGFDVKPEPIDAFGLRRFFTRDPAGTRVEIGSR